MLLLAGLSASHGQFTITVATPVLPPGKFRSSTTPRSSSPQALASLFFGQIPDLFSVIGYCIISGVAVWMFSII